MKHLIVLASLICSVNCFSQDPDPQLFQTWYLQSVQSNDFAPLVYVTQIAPPITPTLTISNTLTFTGQGACNTFNGTISNATSNYWQITSYSESGLDCGIPSHNSFEDNYFGFMQLGFMQYYIYPEGSGLGLVMNTAIFGQARFQNFPLSTADFGLDKIAVYPNPAKDIINIKANQVAVSKIQIINSLGQNVKTINESFEAIAIAELAPGIYIVQIDSELETINRKIIKE